MNITVTADEPQDSKLQVTLTVSAKDVDREVAKAYKEIANKYNFQGFRKGRAPRPVIDSMVGKQSVLADATNEVLAQAEPLMLDQLDVVPVGDIDYGQVELVAEHADYVATCTIELIPEAELSSYDAPEITMPPAEVTEAEVDQQSEVLASYHAHFDDAEEGAEVKAGDMAQLDITNVENGEDFAAEGRMVLVGQGMVPAELDQALVGMKVGDAKEVAFDMPAAEEGAEPKHVVINVAVVGLNVMHTPDLTDEFVNQAFGFDDLAAFREALSTEIKADKDAHLPSLKEERAIIELTKRLELDEVPATYNQQVYTEIARQFLQDLQAQGQTLESFTKMRQITMDQLMADLREQASEHARQSIALDALARHLNIEVTEDDVREQFADAYGQDNADAAMADFAKNGQLPAVRQTIKRSKAVNWLIDNVKVTEVDEIAQKRAAAN